MGSNWRILAFLFFMLGIMLPVLILRRLQAKAIYYYLLLPLIYGVSGVVFMWGYGISSPSLLGLTAVVFLVNGFGAAWSMTNFWPR